MKAQGFDMVHQFDICTSKWLVFRFQLTQFIRFQLVVLGIYQNDLFIGQPELDVEHKWNLWVIRYVWWKVFHLKSTVALSVELTWRLSYKILSKKKIIKWMNKISSKILHGINAIVWSEDMNYWSSIILWTFSLYLSRTDWEGDIACCRDWFAAC